MDRRACWPPMAARDPGDPRQGRGGGRAARPCRPRFRRPTRCLRLAAGPRRAAPGGSATLAPARRAADARDGFGGPPGSPADASHDRQPARPADGPQPARAALRRRAAGHGLARRHLLSADRRGLALPGRHRGPGHARGRRLVDGRPPAGRAVRRRPGHGPAAVRSARRIDPPQRSRRAGRIQAIAATPRGRRLRWAFEDGGRIGRAGARCARRGGPRWRGARIIVGSGRRSPWVAQARTRPLASGSRRS